MQNSKGLDDISWHDEESVIDPTKYIEEQHDIVHCAIAEFKFGNFIDILEDHDISKDRDKPNSELYAIRYIRNMLEFALEDIYTVPELIEEQGNNATRTYKVEYSDIDITWMDREGVNAYAINVTLSQEVADFIEKFQEENS